MLTAPGVQDIPLDIVFEDEHLMVVNKPAGMVVHPSAGHWEQGTLVHALLHHLQRPAIDLQHGSVEGEAPTRQCVRMLQQQSRCIRDRACWCLCCSTLCSELPSIFSSV